MTDDRIITRANLWDTTTANGVPDTSITAEGLRDSLREFARQFPKDERIAGRLEAGELVRRHLTEVAERAPRRPEWSPQPAMVGLPIVHNDNLQPDEWLLLDTDGGVMGEGRIEWKPHHLSADHGGPTVTTISFGNLDNPTGREEACNWIRANGLDPDQIPEQAPIHINGDHITVRYVIRDEHDDVRLDGNRQPLTEQRTVPMVRQWEGSTDLLPVAKWGHDVPVASGTCQNCGVSLLYNLRVGFCQHTADTTCTDPWPAPLTDTTP